MLLLEPFGEKCNFVNKSVKMYFIQRTMYMFEVNALLAVHINCLGH